MRYTEANYIVDLREINQQLAREGSVAYAVYGGRYSQTYCDEMRVTPEGEITHYSNCGGGTPRIAQVKALKLALHAYRPSKITREQAKVLAYIAGVPMDADFHALSQEQKETLISLAKKSGYRRPRMASGSFARYFYDHLNKRVHVDFNGYGFATTGLLS